MSFMPIREKAARYEWCASAVRELAAELEAGAEAYDGILLQIPQEPGGWWHNYVCPEHHTELLFDPSEQDARLYRCPYGCELSGETFRGAWLVFKHQSLARRALQAAAVYAVTGDARHARLGKAIIVRYAEQFPHYPVHQGASAWMLKGRAFHQALTEAIWATTLIRAYLLLRDEGVSFEDEQADLERFWTMLGDSMGEYHAILTKERGNPENNYTAWLNAALSAVYAAQGEHGKLLAQLDREGGFRHHLAIAVRPDQLEFEGSVYYHAFVVRAYLISAEMALRAGEDIYRWAAPEEQSIAGMLEVLAQLAGPDGRLPALHDGPYWREPYALELAEIFEIGMSRFGDEKLLPMLADVYRRLYPESGARLGLEAVLYGDGQLSSADEMAQRADAASGLLSNPSILLSDSGFAILTHSDNRLSGLVDFGPHGGPHGHFDKLHLMLRHREYTLSPDPGTVPYGSRLKKDWYAHTACHNTVTVGGRSQQEAEGECLRFEAADSYSYVWLRSAKAYEGAVLERHIRIERDWIVDWFEVELAETATIDWWFHVKGAFDFGAGVIQEDVSVSGRKLGDRDGYAEIEAVSRIESRPAGLLGLRIHQTGMESSEPVSVSLWLERDTELLRVTSLGTADDPHRRREGLLARHSGRRARFIAVYSAGNAMPVLSLEEDGTLAVKLIGSEDREEMHYELTDSGLRERIGT
ncbi:heparinase II/III family protein [Paenibacillus sp. NPDC058071]|uniref:heparinase II/III domain-containing protein n=1 Tax=Paenibacillus sp. NPDC058071 TaxID=3346326 RepID=UPI0036DF2FC9